MTEPSRERPNLSDWIEAEWTPAATGYRHETRLPVWPELSGVQLAVAEEEVWRLLHQDGIRDVRMVIDDEQLLVTIGASRRDLDECCANRRLADAADRAIGRARRPLS